MRLCEQGFQLLSPERRRRMFFTYEKRIRELSPPDKTFDYFASVKQGCDGPVGSRCATCGSWATGTLLHCSAASSLSCKVSSLLHI